MARKIINSLDVMNGMGGGDAIISMFKKMGFMKFLDDSLGNRSKRAEYTYSEALVMWFVSVYSGARRLEDVHHYRDNLRAHPQLRKGMSPDTFSKVVKELSVPNKYYQIGERPDIFKDGNEVNLNPKLNRLLVESCLKMGLLKKNVSYILDYDTTSIFSKIKGGRKIYEGKGKRGYSNALVAINHLPIYFEGRNGNSSPKFRLVQIICEAIDLLAEYGIKVDLVRVDGAAYSKYFVDEMNRRKIRFITRVRDNTVSKHIRSNPIDWVKGEGIIDDLCEFNYHFGDKEHRVVTHKSPDYTGGLITNDFNSSKEEIVKLYRERSYESEGVFKNLKDEFLWKLPAMRTIEHNSTFMAIQALSYIAFKYLARKLSTKLSFVRSNMELKTFRSDFICVVLEWVGDSMKFYSPQRDYRPMSGFV